MNLASFSLKNKLLIYALSIIALAYGFFTYENMGKLQDPEFTIKDAIVITKYPGASASEVEKEVTNPLEDAIQEIQEVKYINAKSQRGESLIVVRIKDQYGASRLSQIWDQLRKKISDAQRHLPPRASRSIINDDYGDVYGVVYAIYGDEYSYEELKDFTDYLEKELVLVDGVGKIDTFGVQKRALYLEMDKETLFKIGLTKEQILRELYVKNLVANYGSVHLGEKLTPIQTNQNFKSTQDIGNILIKGVRGESQIFLKDIATIKEGYIDPPTNMLEYDGHQAIALGISTSSGGNVIEMGKKIDAKMAELNKQKPQGMHIGTIAHQAKSVEKAIDTFVMNLIQAVFIVIAVLLLFMGLRSGLIIGFVLIVTILGSFVFMPTLDVILQRVSLGAFIIALGMLVDNAIVVVDGIYTRINKGMAREDAAKDVIRQTGLPLLGATVIGILAFGAIGLSDDATGEFTRSLFLVILVSLSLSWFTAMTLTPLLAVKFLKKDKNSDKKEEHSSFFYKFYGKFLKFSINHRYIILIIAVAGLVLAISNFKHIKQNFFPDSPRPQILVDFILPQNTSIDATQNTVGKITKDIENIQGIEHISSFIGQGGLRFLLTYAPEHPNSAYAQMLIDVSDYKHSTRIIKEVQKRVKTNYPDVNVFGKKFLLGPGSGGKIQVKIFGKELDKIRQYEEQILEIFHNEPLAKGVRSDWRERVKVLRPIIAKEKANLNGITEDDIANVILESFEGRDVGVYRDGSDLLPIILRAPKEQREEIKNIQNLQIYSPVAKKMIPIRQVVEDFKIEFEDDIIYTYNRKRALTIHADPKEGYLPNELLANVKKKIDNINYESGYQIQWHGEYKDSKESKEPIIKSLPLFGGLMFLIVLGLFNSLRKTLIIWLTVPFATIGVVIGLFSMGAPFGFMSLLGFLSLSGMLIKNAIVLIDEITQEHEVHKKPLELSIYNSGLNRLRAVSMAALTTALGMLPLVQDVFFSSMAIVIIFGLMVATMLTMILIPVLYAIFFKSKKIS